jgi:phage-related protein (TIGR01555 family)
LGGKSVKGVKPARVKRMTGDAFNNRTLRLGVGSGNAIGNDEYIVDFLTNNYNKLRSMYRSNWVCRKIIDLAPKDMLRAGFDITGDLDPKAIDRIKGAWKSKKLNDKLFKTMSYARLFGGAIAFVIIKGQDLSTPLRLDTITKGQFLGVKVYDRWQVIPSVEVDLIDEEPIYYDIVPIIGNYTGQMEANIGNNSKSFGMRVHASRCIKLYGDELPYIDWINNMRWGASILEGISDRLNYYNTSTAALTSMILKAGFRIVKIDNFRDVLANRGNDGNRSYSKLESLMDLMTYTQSVEGATVIDSKDSVEVAGYNFQNIDRAIDLLKEQIIGATEYSMSVFFQQKNGGLSGNGDNEERAYYDAIASAQEAKLTYPFDLLLDICYRSEFGTSPPEDYGFTFEPLWQLSDTEKANIANTTSSAVVNVFNAGIIGRDTALRELKKSETTTGIYGSITDDEIKEAEDEEPPTGEDIELEEMPLPADKQADE